MKQPKSTLQVVAGAPQLKRQPSTQEKGFSGYVMPKMPKPDLRMPQDPTRIPTTQASPDPMATSANINNIADINNNAPGGRNIW